MNYSTEFDKGDMVYGLEIDEENNVRLLTDLLPVEAVLIASNQSGVQVSYVLRGRAYPAVHVFSGRTPICELPSKNPGAKS